MRRYLGGLGGNLRLLRQHQVDQIILGKPKKGFASHGYGKSNPP
ncbi:hypothetical protein [Acidiphilium sp. AL]|nr:hypothetical protein [Acidiphilium sp. AL]